jgi:tetratricopeptide (TPR) repeat protein
LQQYQRGLADCKASIAIQPRYSYAYQNLGVSLLALGDASNAIAAFSKAIELKPNFIFSYLNRAKAFASLGNNASAKRDFERALTIDPTNQEANEGIAALGNPLRLLFATSHKQDQPRRMKERPQGRAFLFPCPATF